MNSWSTNRRANNPLLFSSIKFLLKQKMSVITIKPHASSHPRSSSYQKYLVLKKNGFDKIQLLLCPAPVVSNRSRGQVVRFHEIRRHSCDLRNRQKIVFSPEMTETMQTKPSYPFHLLRKVEKDIFEF